MEIRVTAPVENSPGRGRRDVGSKGDRRATRIIYLPLSTQPTAACEDTNRHLKSNKNPSIRLADCIIILNTKRSFNGKE